MRTGLIHIIAAALLLSSCFGVLLARQIQTVARCLQQRLVRSASICLGTDL